MVVPFIVCFILLGVGGFLIFDLFKIREFFTGQGSPLSELRLVQEAFVSVGSQVIGAFFCILAVLGVFVISPSL
ncbi:hypothetical protein C0Q59_18930 [Streptomyces albidoflavus]|nr:hypothetical protein C0Q59_18930 [Streptomyces albidoflavus]